MKTFRGELEEYIEEYKKEKRQRLESKKQEEHEQWIRDWENRANLWKLGKNDSMLWGEVNTQTVFLYIRGRMPYSISIIARNYGYNLIGHGVAPKTEEEKKLVETLLKTHQETEKQEIARYRSIVESSLEETLTYLEKVGRYPPNYPKPNIELMQFTNISEIMKKILSDIYEKMLESINKMSDKERHMQAVEEISEKTLQLLRTKGQIGEETNILLHIPYSELSEAAVVNFTRYIKGNIEFTRAHDFVHVKIRTLIFTNI